MRASGAQTLVIEELKTPGENLSRELRAITDHFGKAPDELSAYRFTFFACPEGDFGGIQSSFVDHFLGFFTVLNISYRWRKSFSYVMESVIAPPRCPVDADCPEGLPGHYYHAVREFDIEVAGLGRHSVVGSYFCQQNGIMHVCGHNALRAALINSGVVDPHEASAETLKKGLLGMYPKWASGFRPIQRTIPG
jgi:hypothetical protein